MLNMAADPSALASAARVIDGFLLNAPNEFGESRYEFMRIAFVLPLAVQFEVMDDVRTVIVHDAWSVDQR